MKNVSDMKSVTIHLHLLPFFFNNHASLDEFTSLQAVHTAMTTKPLLWFTFKSALHLYVHVKLWLGSTLSLCGGLSKGICVLETPNSYIT